MTTKFDWSKFEEEAPSSDSKFDWSKFEKEGPSRTRSLVSAPIKGILKGAKDINPLLPNGPIPKKLMDRAFEEVLPTQDQPAERLLERGGKLAPVVALGPEGIGLKALQLAGGTLFGEAAKEMGFGELGQDIAELGGIGAAQLAKGITKRAISKFKAPFEQMDSGLTKPRVLNAKNPRLGTLTKIQQQKSIEKLNNEAANLTQESIFKNVPLSKDIHEGFNFESKFQKGFSEVEKSAAKANPEINITPVSNLLAENRKKFSGIPNLHQEGKKIAAEIRAFGDRPQTGLRNLMKIFRSNNQKKKHIYETAHLTGRQKEYVTFLDDYNRAIVDSVKKTLPEDSVWLKQFLETNKDYGNYQKAQKTIQSLREAFNENPTMKKIERLSQDVKAQKRLAHSMGEQGANEVIQISEDLKKAKDAIKKIPRKEWGKWDAAFSLGILVPFIGKPFGIFKGAQLLRGGYGWLLSTPARRKATESALKAIIKNDLDAYKKAALILNREKED